MHTIDELERLEIPLSVKEAARIYGDSPGTFYRRIRRGEIPGVFREQGKKRGRIKICSKMFAAFLREQIAKGGRTEGPAVQGKAMASSLKVEKSERDGPECGDAGKGIGRRLRAAAGR